MAMPQLKTGPKIVLLAVAAVVFIFGLKTAAERGWVPTPGIMKALVPSKVVLPDVKDAMVKDVEPVALPTATPAYDPKLPAPTLIRGEIWEWNAQANLIYANGGPATTKGSLMEKHGVNLALIRQDDTTQMRNDLVSCAKELHDGATQCSTGANFIVIMGDGAGQFLAFANPLLKALGPEWQAKAIGATGYSRGEDAFMAAPEIKTNPQAARGILVAGVLRDGDWNIALKWSGDNSIPNNPDEHTYDPNAINWMNADDYLKATESYNAGQCEDRKVVKDGHPTGETKHICVNAIVTWTPGDVNEAHGKGGLAKIVSSKQYRSQMPATIIGPASFFQKNREEIQGMLAATFEAGDQMKAFDQALHKAAAISAKVYNDQSESYWYRYFKGATETDTQGVKIELGGSSVNNLADEKILFGLQSGSNDNFRSTYSLFAKIATEQYPTLFAKNPIPDVKDVVDKSFILGAEASMNNVGGEAEDTNYNAQKYGPTVSKRGYNITFASNSATLTAEGEQVVRQLRDDVAITGLAVKIDGYTDNAGNDTINIPLSKARAESVKHWLQQHAAKNFPDSRFASIDGHGSENPVAPNTTAEGRAANRRTEITLVGN